MNSSAAVNVSRVDAATAASGSTDRDFEQFYNSHYRALSAYARYLGANPHEADDAVQLAMITMLERWGQIKMPDAYAYAAVKRRVSDEQRRSYQRIYPLEAHKPVVEPFDREGRLGARDALDLLRHLPPRQQGVMALYIDGYTVEEIASATDTTESTVRSTLRHARNRLKSILNEQLDEHVGPTPDLGNLLRHSQ